MGARVLLLNGLFSVSFHRRFFSAARPLKVDASSVVVSFQHAPPFLLRTGAGVPFFSGGTVAFLAPPPPRGAGAATFPSSLTRRGTDSEGRKAAFPTRLMNERNVALLQSPTSRLAGLTLAAPAGKRVRPLVVIVNVIVFSQWHQETSLDYRNRRSALPYGGRRNATRLHGWRRNNNGASFSLRLQPERGRFSVYLARFLPRSETHRSFPGRSRRRCSLLDRRTPLRLACFLLSMRLQALLPRELGSGNGDTYGGFWGEEGGSRRAPCRWVDLLSFSAPLRLVEACDGRRAVTIRLHEGSRRNSSRGRWSE